MIISFLQFVTKNAECVRMWITYYTSSMENRRHDGRHPGCLAVASVELCLKVCVEDAHAGWKGKCKGQHQDSGNQHHPTPASIRCLDASWMGSGRDGARCHHVPLLAFSLCELSVPRVQGGGLLPGYLHDLVGAAVGTFTLLTVVHHHLLGPVGKALALAVSVWPWEALWLLHSMSHQSLLYQLVQVQQQGAQQLVIHKQKNNNTHKTHKKSLKEQILSYNFPTILGLGSDF